MFNLNDGRWGRGDEPSSNGSRPPDANPPGAPTPPPSSNGGNNGNNDNRPRGQGPNQGPPDLDELWRDLNRKLGGFFGGKGGSNRPNGRRSG